MLRNRYGVQGYPTYLFLEPDGKTVIGQEGADPDADPAGFVRKVGALLRHSQDAIEKTAAALPKEQGDAYRQQVKELASATADLKAWLASNPTRSEKNERKFETFLSTIDSLEASTLSMAVHARLRTVAGESSDSYLQLLEKARRLDELASAVSEQTTLTEDWLLTSSPGASDENLKRLEDLMKSVHEALTEIENL